MAAGIKNKDLDDETLAREMRAGSHGAFEEIMRRYKARLYAFICRYVTDREEAYDLLQETFVSIYEKFIFMIRRDGFPPGRFRLP